MIVYFFEIMSVIKYTFQKSVGILLSCKLYFRHLCHLWHKYINHGNEADNSVNALQIKSMLILECTLRICDKNLHINNIQYLITS